MLSNNRVSYVILELEKKITWEQKGFSQWADAAPECWIGLKAMREIGREDSREENTELHLVM